jgi:hypothetical protein
MAWLTHIPHHPPCFANSLTLPETVVDLSGFEQEMAGRECLALIHRSGPA